MPRRETGRDGFQKEVIDNLRSLFPEAIILKNDPTYLQGVPDLLILLGPRWATLECKISRIAPFQPNQRYYVGKMNAWSFSAFIYPDNKDEVLCELQRALQSDW